MIADAAAVRSTLAWLVVVALVAQVPAAVGVGVARPGSVPGVALAVAAALLVAVAGLVRRAAAGLDVTGPVRAVAAASALGVLVHAWAPDRGVDPALLPLFATGACAVVLLPGRVPLLVVPAVAVAAAWVRRPAVPPTTALATGAVTLLLALAWLAVVRAVERAAQAAPSDVAAGWDAVEERERAAARAREWEAWRGLVHDKVLGALGAARPGPVPVAARELAADALAYLRDDARPEASLEARWRRHAARLGLAAEVRVVDHGTDPGVREAVAAAVEEALTNVHRHSGQHLVSVVAELTEHEVRAEVRDGGVGIGGGATGLGLAGIEARLRAVGGRARVGPAEGGGTVVVLTWPGRDPGPGVALPASRGPWALPALAGAVTAAALGALALLGPERTGVAAAVRVGEVVAAVLAVVAAAWVVRSALAEARGLVEAMTSRAAEVRVALAAEAARREEAARLATRLEEHVAGALELLRDAPTIDEEQVAALGRLAFMARVRLVAPDLVDEPLVVALADARDAGARIDVVPGRRPDDDAAPGPGADASAALAEAGRAVLRAVLADAGPGTAVRVTWAGAGASTVAVVAPGEGLAPRVREAAARVADRVRVTVDADEDALLVELAPAAGRAARRR